MEPQSIIALVAVCVSAITVLVSFLTNKINLSHAAKMKDKDLVYEHRHDCWYKLIDVTDKYCDLILMESIKKVYNEIAVLKSNEQEDHGIINRINGIISQIRTLSYKCEIYHKAAISGDSGFIAHLHQISSDAINFFETLQRLYHSDYETAVSMSEQIRELFPAYDERANNFLEVAKTEICSMEIKDFTNIAKEKKEKVNG